MKNPLFSIWTQPVLSLKKEKEVVQAVLIEKRWKQLIVNRFHRFCLKDPASIPFELKQLLNTDSPRLVGLSALAGMMKRLDFPDLSAKKIKQILQFQKETVFPYPIEGMRLIEEKIKGKKRCEIRYTLLNEEAITSTLTDMLSIGVEPDCMVLDSLGLEELVKGNSFSDSGAYIHLNGETCLLFIYEHHEVKHRFVLSLGYFDVEEELKEKSFDETTLFHQIKNIFFVQKIQPIQFYFSGYFTKIDPLFTFFPSGQFLFYPDLERCFFAQEIGNSQLYFSRKKQRVDLDGYGLKRKEEKWNQQKSRFRKAVAMVLASLTLIAGTFSVLINQKVRQVFLAFSPIQSASHLFVLLDQLEKKEKRMPLLLDIQREPLSNAKILDFLSEELKHRTVILKNYRFRLIRRPTFKAPLDSFVQELELCVQGADRQILEFVEELKKSHFFPLKKEIKIEKSQHVYQIKIQFRSA